MKKLILICLLSLMIPMSVEAQDPFHLVKYVSDDMLSPGAYVVSTGPTSYLMDNSGVIIHTKHFPCTGEFIRGGIDIRSTNVRHMPYAYIDCDATLVYMDEDFNDVHRVSHGFPYGDFHDVHVLRNGTHFFASYGQPRNPDGSVDFSDRSPWDFQINATDIHGNLLWNWRMLDHVTPIAGQDWHHWNSFWYDYDTDTLILSFRGMDTIMGVRYPSGEVSWALGAIYGDISLLPDPRWEPYMYTCGAHDARWYKSASGTPVLTAFDNGIGCRDFSRAVEYEIDLTNKKGVQIWEFRGPYSFAIGSYMRLHNGNRLIGWGAANRLDPINPSIAASEVSPNGEVLAEIYWNDPNSISYRVNKIFIRAGFLELNEVVYMPRF